MDYGRPPPPPPPAPAPPHYPADGNTPSPTRENTDFEIYERGTPEELGDSLPPTQNWEPTNRSYTWKSLGAAGALLEALLDPARLTDVVDELSEEGAHARNILLGEVEWHACRLVEAEESGKNTTVD